MKNEKKELLKNIRDGFALACVSVGLVAFCGLLVTLSSPPEDSKEKTGCCEECEECSCCTTSDENGNQDDCLEAE